MSVSWSWYGHVIVDTWDWRVRTLIGRRMQVFVSLRCVVAGKQRTFAIDQVHVYVLPHISKTVMI